MNQHLQNTNHVLLIVKGLQTHLGSQLADHLDTDLAKRIQNYDPAKDFLTEAEFRVASSLLMRYMRFLAEG